MNGIPPSQPDDDLEGVEKPVAIVFTLGTPPPTEPPAHATMCSVDGFAVHQRTAPDNAVDSPGLTLPNRLLRDATSAEGTVEPDMIDATVQTLPHHLDRDVGMSGNDDPVDGAWN